MTKLTENYRMNIDKKCQEMSIYRYEIDRYTDKVKNCAITTTDKENNIYSLREKKTTIMDYKKIRLDIIKNILLKDGISTAVLILVESLFPLTSYNINLFLMFATFGLLGTKAINKYKKKMKYNKEVLANYTIEGLNNEIFDEISKIRVNKEEQEKYAKVKKELVVQKDALSDELVYLRNQLDYYNNILKRVKGTKFKCKKETFTIDEKNNKKLIKIIK